MENKEALDILSNIDLYHKEIYEDEDFDGEWIVEEHAEYDGTVAEVYHQEIEILAQALDHLNSLKKEHDYLSTKYDAIDKEYINLLVHKHKLEKIITDFIGYLDKDKTKSIPKYSIKEVLNKLIKEAF